MKFSQKIVCMMLLVLAAFFSTLFSTFFSSSLLMYCSTISGLVFTAFQAILRHSPKMISEDLQL